MYEFTLGGSWFRWDLLDRTNRWLAGASFVAAGIAVVPATLALGEYAFEVGRHVGSDGRVPLPPAFQLLPWAAWWFVAFSVASGLFWWRFSLRQDELFNRVQNWALAMGGAWSATLLSLWEVLSLGGVLRPVSPGAIIATFCVLVSVFWFAAVRRWV